MSRKKATLSHDQTQDVENVILIQGLSPFF